MKRILVLLSAALALASDALAQPTFRIGVGNVIGRSTTVRDSDCASTTPAALFGCADGLSGRALGARGAIGHSPVVEAAAGVVFSRRFTGELALAWRPELNLEANANFLGVAPFQPVTARGESLSLLATGSLDVGREHWPVRPFFTGGAGIARNSLDDVTYSFPSIGAGAATITPGGTNTDFAWMAGAGVSVPVTARLSIELLVRHSDLGEFRTDAGTTTIVRPTRTLTIDTAPTEAALRMNGLMLSVRWR